LFAFVLFFCAVAEGLFQKDQVTAEFQLGEHQAAQRLEGLPLLRRQFAGYLVDYTERAKRVAILVDKRCSGVEADVRVRNDKRIIAKAFVLERVWNHKDVRLQNRCRTKGDFARRFSSREAYARFKPLAVVVDQGDERNGSLTDKRSQLSQIIEGFFRIGIEATARTLIQHAYIADQTPYRTPSQFARGMRESGIFGVVASTWYWELQASTFRRGMIPVSFVAGAGAQTSAQGRFCPLAAGLEADVANGADESGPALCRGDPGPSFLTALTSAELLMVPASPSGGL